MSATYVGQQLRAKGPVAVVSGFIKILEVVAENPNWSENQVLGLRLSDFFANTVSRSGAPASSLTPEQGAEIEAFINAQVAMLAADADAAQGHSVNLATGDIYNTIGLAIKAFLNNLLYMDDKAISYEDCVLIRKYLINIGRALEAAQKNIHTAVFFQKIDADYFEALFHAVNARMEGLRELATRLKTPRQLIAEMRTTFTAATTIAAARSEKFRELEQDPGIAGQSPMAYNARKLAFLARLALDPNAMKAAMMQKTQNLQGAARTMQLKQNIISLYFEYNAVLTFCVMERIGAREILESFLRNLMSQVEELPHKDLLTSEAVAATVFRNKEVLELFRSYHDAVDDSSSAVMPLAELESVANTYIFFLAVQVMAENFFAVAPPSRRSTIAAAATTSGAPLIARQELLLDQSPDMFSQYTTESLRKRNSGHKKTESYSAPAFQDRIAGVPWTASQIRGALENMLRLNRLGELEIYMKYPVIIDMVLKLYAGYRTRINENSPWAVAMRLQIEEFLMKLLRHECDRFPTYPAEPELAALQQESLKVMQSAYEFLVTTHNLKDATYYLRQIATDPNTGRETANITNAFQLQLHNRLAEARGSDSRLSPG